MVAAASGDGVGLAAGVTVSVFCSQAASSAAPAKMQIYFFIFFWIENSILGHDNGRSKGTFCFASGFLKRRLEFHSVRVGHGLAG